MRVDRRSPNALAELLSIRPLISTIVTLPACCSAISISLLRFHSFFQDQHIEPPGPFILHLIHQRLDEIDAKTADLSRLQRSFGHLRIDLGWIEGLAVVLYLDR